MKTMIAGLAQLKAFSKGNKLSIVHIDSDMVKGNMSSFDNFKGIHVHCLFEHDGISLIGEICFVLADVWRTYARKCDIIDTYSRLIPRGNVLKVVYNRLQKDLDYRWQ